MILMYYVQFTCFLLLAPSYCYSRCTCIYSSCANDNVTIAHNVSANLNLNTSETDVYDKFDACVIYVAIKESSSEHIPRANTRH